MLERFILNAIVNKFSDAKSMLRKDSLDGREKRSINNDRFSTQSALAAVGGLVMFLMTQEQTAAVVIGEVAATAIIAALYLYSPGEG